MYNRFIKFIPSANSDFLQENHPTAFLLLCLIAKRARRTSGGLDGLQIGDALIGDYESAGLTRQQYRTAINKLVELGFIEIIYNGKNFLKREKSTIKITIKGMLVNLKDSSIWDINSEESNQHINQRPTNSQPTANHEQERIRKNKKEKEKHTPPTPSLEEENEERVGVSFDHSEKSNKEKSYTEKTIPLKHKFGESSLVELTYDQQQKLLNIMSQEEFDYWISQIEIEIHRKGDVFEKNNRSHYHAILAFKDYREKKQKTIQKPKEGVNLEENFKYSCQAERCLESLDWNLDSGTSYVQFIPKYSAAQPYILEYKEFGFKDQMQNLLRKCGFRSKGILKTG